MGIELSLNKARPIDPQIMNHPNVGYLARHGLRRHYSVRVGGWNLPGFFIGDANNTEELVTFWNLRAADISLYFIDLNHPERYRAILPYPDGTPSTTAGEPSRISAAPRNLD